MPFPRGRRLAFEASLVLIAGGLVLLVVAQARLLWLPPWLQPIGHALFRLAYWVILPVVLALALLAPGSGHGLAAWKWAAAALATPALAWALWRAWPRRARAGPAAGSGRDDPSAGPADPGRRVALRRIGLGVAGCAVLGTGAYGCLVSPRRLRVRRYALDVAGLPPELDGLRLVHLSDTHHGPYVDLPYLESVIARANALAPDLVVMTGDYVHQTARAIGPGIGVLGALRGRLGTVAVLGNHDHWEGASACRDACRRAGVQLIDNERLFVSAAGLGRAPSAGALCVAGIGDLWEDEQRWDRALAGVPEATPRVILAHNPDSAERMPDERVDLMLCGHTHGGQVLVPLLGTPIVPSAYGGKYAGGLCQGPRCRVLVSRGVGMAVLPVRLGVPPEIGEITLRAGS